MCNRKNYQFIGLKGIFFRLIFSPKFYYGRHVESILFPGVSDIENVEINYWAKIENLIIERKLRIFKRFLVRIFRMITNFLKKLKHFIDIFYLTFSKFSDKFLWIWHHRPNPSITHQRRKVLQSKFSTRILKFKCNAVFWEFSRF